MAQWVKNLTAAAQVVAEARLGPPVWCSRLKDPALLQPWPRSQLPLEFRPWPGNFNKVPVRPLGEKKKKKKPSSFSGPGPHLNSFTQLRGSKIFLESFRS